MKKKINEAISKQTSKDIIYELIDIREMFSDIQYVLQKMVKNPGLMPDRMKQFYNKALELANNGADAVETIKIKIREETE